MLILKIILKILFCLFNTLCIHYVWYSNYIVDSKCSIALICTILIFLYIVRLVLEICKFKKFKFTSHEDVQISLKLFDFFNFLFFFGSIGLFYKVFMIEMGYNLEGIIKIGFFNKSFSFIKVYSLSEKSHFINIFLEELNNNSLKMNMINIVIVLDDEINTFLLGLSNLKDIKSELVIWFNSKESLLYEEHLSALHEESNKEFLHLLYNWYYSKKYIFFYSTMMFFFISTILILNLHSSLLTVNVMDIAKNQKVIKDDVSSLKETINNPIELKVFLELLDNDSFFSEFIKIYNKSNKSTSTDEIEVD